MVEWVTLERPAAAASHISLPPAPFPPLTFQPSFLDRSRHAFHQTALECPPSPPLPLPRAHPLRGQGIVFIGMEGEGANAKFNVSDEAMEFLETVRR
jgi:hypothetical protein